MIGDGMWRGEEQRRRSKTDEEKKDKIE